MSTSPRWRPLPSAVGLDPRIRYVSAGALRAWLLLVCASDAAGVVRCTAEMDGAATLAAVVGCSEFEAAGYLGELEGAELLTAHVSHLLLVDVQGWSAECTPGAVVGVAPAETSTAPSGTTPRAVALARLRSAFSKRGLKTVDDRRVWLASEEGLARLAELSLSPEDGAAAAGAAGRRGGRFGVDRPAVVATPAPVVATAVADPSDGCSHGCSATTETVVATAVASSPLTLPSETENSREEAGSDARPPVVATAVADPSDGCSATAGAVVATAVANPAPKPPPPSLTTPWSILVDAADGLIDGITADVTVAQRISETLAAKIETDAITPDDLRGFGATLRAEGLRTRFPWVKRSYLRAFDLHGKARDCSPLLEALADWKRARALPAPAATPLPSRPKRAPRTPLTPEQKAALLPAGKDSAA